MAKAIKEMDLPNAVAQHYLAKPLLVNGFKFDMRIYALVRMCTKLASCPAGYAKEKLLTCTMLQLEH